MHGWGSVWHVVELKVFVSNPEDIINRRGELSHPKSQIPQIEDIEARK